MNKRVPYLLMLALAVTLNGAVFLEAKAASPEPIFCQASEQRLNQVNNKTGKDKRTLNAEGLPPQPVQPSALKTKQLAWDQVTDGRIHELEAVAGTSDQKAAVSAFKDSFHKAVSAKRTANNALLNKHEGKLSAVRANYRTTLNQILDNRGLALRNAAQTAKNDCNSRRYGDGTVRDRYNLAIRAAQAEYKAHNKKETEAYTASIALSTSNYRSEEQAIQKAYVTEIQQALAELRKALG